MKHRPQFVVSEAGTLSGFVILDVDQTPCHEVCRITQWGRRPKEEDLAEAVRLCAMMNRDADMRDAVNGVRGELQ